MNKYKLHLYAVDLSEDIKGKDKKLIDIEEKHKKELKQVK